MICELGLVIFFSSQKCFTFIEDPEPYHSQCILNLNNNNTSIWYFFFFKSLCELHLQSSRQYLIWISVNAFYLGKVVPRQGFCGGCWCVLYWSRNAILVMRAIKTLCVSSLVHLITHSLWWLSSVWDCWQKIITKAVLYHSHKSDSRLRTNWHSLHKVPSYALWIVAES